MAERCRKQAYKAISLTTTKSKNVLSLIAQRDSNFFQDWKQPIMPICFMEIYLRLTSISMIKPSLLFTPQKRQRNGDVL